MRIDSRPTDDTRAASPAAPIVATAPASAGHTQVDAMAPATGAAESSAPQASEVDVFMNELRTATRGLGADFPTLNSGSVYGSTSEGFTVPVIEAVHRAREYGIHKPLDFVLGEVGVQLGRARFGYNRTDNRIRDNVALRLVVELVETIHAARAITSTHSGLAAPVQSHVTTIWSAIAERTKQSKAPESVRTFLLSCMARGLGDNKQSAGTVEGHAAKVIAAAVELFDQLTAPPSADDQKLFEQDRNAADKAAAARIERVRNELFPYFGELLMIEMPKPEVKPAGRSLITAEEAAARNTERAASRTKEVKKTTAEANEKAAEADAERVVQMVKRHAMGEDWVNPDRPTPSELRRAITKLVERRDIKEPANIDRTVELALRAASKGALRLTTFATRADRGNDSSPWSFGFLRRLAGPDFQHIMDAAPRSEAVEQLRDTSRPQSSGRMGMGKLFEDKAKTTEAKEWVADNTARVSEIRNSHKLAADLARADGVTQEVARALQDAQREVSGAFDECSRTADSLAKGYDLKLARQFAEARARVQTYIGKHETIMATLRDVSAEQGGTIKRLLRFAAADNSVNAQGVVDGIAKVREAQEPARQHIAAVFAQYADETAELAHVLGPRLDWYATAVDNTQQSRQSDPLLPIFDGAWIGHVSAELRRAEAVADRIISFTKTMPRELREFVAIELESPEALKRAIIATCAANLARRLGGSASNDNALLEVAAVRSRVLPALAARPRLAYVCSANNLFELGMGDVRDIERFGALALPSSNGRNSYDLSAEQVRDNDESQAARGDYNFWCRTFDLEAPAASFLSELVGWGTYHANALADIIRDSNTGDGDDFSRHLNDTIALGAGSHPIADVEGEELRSRYLQIEQLKRRIATNEQALTQLQPFLDASQQPLNVLLHAVTDLDKARDKDRAAAMLSSWLALPDARLREAARKGIAALRGTTVATVIADQLVATDAPVARLMALRDSAVGATTEQQFKTIAALADDADPVMRTFAAYLLSTLATDAKPAITTALADALMAMIGNRDPHVVRFAADGLETLAVQGNAYAAKRVTDWATKTRSDDPQIAAMLETVASRASLSDAILEEVRVVCAVVTEASVAAAREAPRRFKVKRAATASVQQRDLAAVILSAARAQTTERGLEAVSDRMKLSLRLATKFDQWSTLLSPDLRVALEKLDFPDAIVDDAVADLGGKDAAGYLASTPELVSHMFSSAGFSAAEISILETGRVPQALVELANHPMAVDGSWRKLDLAAARSDAKQFETLVKLKLALTTDLPGLVGDVIASIFDDKMPPAIAAIAYDSLVDVLGCDVPLLNPKLDGTQREEAMKAAPALDPAIDALVERAVVDRLAIVNPNGDEAKTLVQYLASGIPEVAERRLSDALDRATSEPQAKLIIDAARVRARVRAHQSSSTKNKNAPWLIAVLTSSRKASIDQIVAVRDARQAAVQTSDSASLGRAADRVATLAAMVLSNRETLPAGELGTLLAILADSEDDASRVSKIDGLRQLMANTSLEWTPSRMQTVRDGLLVVQANQRWGDLSRTLEQTIGFVTRLLGASPELSDADLAKHFEILARLSEMSAKTSYADNIIKMYRTLEGRGMTPSSTFLEQMGLWLAAVEGGSEPDRKREVILAGLLELVPLPDDTMTTLVNQCAALPLQRTSEVLRLCKDHLRTAHLLPKDVESIVAKGGAVEDNGSIFKSLIGAAVALTQWKPSSSAFADPLAKQYNDTFEVAEAKRMLRGSIGGIFDTLAAPRGETAPVAELAVSNAVGNFALGAWSRGAAAARNSDPVAAAAQGAVDFTNMFSSSDYAAHLAQANKLADAALNRVLDGKHPIEQLSGMQANNSRSIAMAFDSMFSKTADTDWERDFTGPRVDTRAFGRAMSARMAMIQFAAEAEARGETVPTSFPSAPVMLRPVEIQTEQRDFNLFVSLVIDNSGSTATDNRLGYFKLLGVMLTNAFSGVSNLNITHAVTKFSDHGQLIMAPAKKQDIKTMIQSMGPLVPEGGTNLADGLDKSNMSVGKGKYDLVVHIVLTDGQPNSVPAAKAVIDTLRQKGHHVVGFGVGPDAENLENVFGRGHAIPEENPDLVAPKVYKYLKEMVERERAR